MHYVPESAREFLPDEPSSSGSVRDRNFHYQSAPVYVLTLLVGALLAADLLIGFVGDPAWTPYRLPFGIRLSLLAAVLGGARILYQSLDGLFEGRIGADLALTVAALAAIMLGEHTTAAIVVFIALCGESIEGYALDRAHSAIRRVFNLCPDRAHAIRDGRELDVPVAELVLGDTVIIRPGERIPVDGRVTAGVSTIDQSALTGESVPVDKSVGAEVFTGTLNQFGSLTVVAQKVGTETTLAKVIRLIAAATEQKTPLERTADRLARIFLPFVLGAALLTLVGWRVWSGGWTAGFQPALGVLVVACPCPLILATPTAVIAAMAWLARTGVVVKGSAGLERLALVDTMAFDKTGTLTRGQLQLGAIHALPPLDETELLRVAAIAERRSEHLFARLIVREAEARNVVAPAALKFTSYPGAGVLAKVRATMLGPWAQTNTSGSDVENDEDREAIRTVGVGNRAFLEARHATVPSELEPVVRHLERSAASLLFVAVDEQVLGVIGVRDTIREESHSVIAELRQAGIRSFALLTGDRKESAQSIAESLELVDDVEAGLLPADKARWIEARVREGRRIAMIGDGVNDAPALAAATVGIALGSVGSDIAADAGDIVLMGDPLRPLPGLLRLSQALVANIRQSILFFAFGMNALGILLCAGGVLSPVGGAVFHEFSSLAVMMNAMRLLWFERSGQTALGSTWQTIAAALEWLTNALSPRRTVFRLLENWSLLIGLAVPAVILVWLTSGVVCIRENERGVVTQFGRATDDLGPGLYWRFPPPFERVYREPVDQLRIVQLGFRARDDRPTVAEDSLRSPIEWTSEHNEPGFLPHAEESLVLTGDEVLVEMTAEVQWRITSLRHYLFRAVKPADTVRMAAETVLRQIAAHRSLDGILTERRREIENECLGHLRGRIQRLDLGIEVVEVNLLDVHPPRAVVGAYRDVADALEDQDQRVNEAEAYYSSKLLAVAGERAVRMLNGTVAGARRTADESTTGTVVDWNLTDALWNRLTADDSSPSGVMLSGESASVLLGARQAAATTTFEAQGQAARFNELLTAYQAQPRLTTTQLYWRSIVDSLTGRPVTVIDPKAGGRKRLVLGNASDLSPSAILRNSELEPTPPMEPSGIRLPDELIRDPDPNADSASQRNATP
jgi:Cu+-exporting ATPase